ncbi:hypothetical protein RFI_03134 [Reticulomyxa filosa]|uniref:Uncharacterized protein n=1 Tax=Reticulomyxa filosa TaxID=46433 RepID=X6P8J3_RETFI|nr:hypothetical protein RFI_03134 [Reticulomyxa filosa]|eukprot:ETO33962.1 hypothetical protein RFI_03134 [Reticulomyxa filosa]
MNCCSIIIKICMLYVIYNNIYIFIFYLFICVIVQKVIPNLLRQLSKKKKKKKENEENKYDKDCNYCKNDNDIKYSTLSSSEELTNKKKNTIFNIKFRFDEYIHQVDIMYNILSQQKYSNQVHIVD